MRQKKISSPHTCWLSTPTLYFWTTELALSCLISKIHLGKVFCLLWGLENVKGRGGGRRRKRRRRRRRRRGWWCQKEERGRVNRKITVDKGVGGNHEMDWRKLTCDLRFITPTSVDSSKRDRGIKMVSNCSHLLYTRISLH